MAVETTTLALREDAYPLQRQTVVMDNVATIATSDREFFLLWLDAKGNRSPSTRDNYRREGNRLLCWLKETGLSLRDMKVEHVHAYYDHLAHPPSHWIRPRKARLNQSLLETQLLLTGLNGDAIAYTRTVLSQLYGYGQDIGYIGRNVFKLSQKPSVVKGNSPTRFLDMESWFWLWGWVVDLAKTARNRKEKLFAVRSRWLLALAYHTGIRREEIAKGRMGDFYRQDGTWFLRVVGKGSAVRSLTINSALLKELKLLRSFYQLPTLPSQDEQFPLIPSIHDQSKSCLSPRSINLLFKQISDASAAACEDMPQIKTRLSQMTTHWMRHTNATHRFMAGASSESTQDELGHKDPKTTRIYQKVLTGKRIAEAEKLTTLQNDLGNGVS